MQKLEVCDLLVLSESLKPLAAEKSRAEHAHSTSDATYTNHNVESDIIRNSPVVHSRLNPPVSFCPLPHTPC